MFEHWHEFYLLLGTAAAALVALLFVAASIGVDYLTPARAGATRTFMSPVIFHYTAVLFFSLVALAQWPALQALGLVTGVAGIAGTIYAIFVLVRVARSDMSDGADVCAYGLVPAAAYAALILAGRMLSTGAELAPQLYAGALVVLLVANIRNAWDLMLSMIWRHGEAVHEEKKS